MVKARKANNGGKAFGVCNGFQILCEAGLLPGVLLHNDNQKFICKNIELKVESKDSLLTRSIDQDQLTIPIAHADGRFFAKDEVLDEIQANDQILFKYCDEEGNVTEEANPNGSVLNIAGIRNKAGNVFGMMPHPERAAEDDLGNTDGKSLFESLLATAGVLS